MSPISSGDSPLLEVIDTIIKSLLLLSSLESNFINRKFSSVYIFYLVNPLTNIVLFIFPINCKNRKKCFLARCYIEIAVLCNKNPDNKIPFLESCKSIIVDIMSKYMIG